MQSGSVSARFMETAYKVKYFKLIPKDDDDDDHDVHPYLYFEDAVTHRYQ